MPRGMPPQPQPLLLVAACRRVDAAGAVRRRAAPDALVPARTMPVYLVRGVDAAMAVARAAAPLAVLFVVTVLVDLVRTVYAAVPVACAAAMSAFARHLQSSLASNDTTIRLAKATAVHVIG